MSCSFPPASPSNSRVFTALLLSFVVWMTPLAPVAAATLNGARTVKNNAVKNRGGGPAEEEEGTLLFGNQLLAAPAAAPVAGPIIATKADSFPVHPSGKAEPGDTIDYTVNVSNAGGTDAAGVSFTDSIDPNSTFVPGSVKASPVAVNDTYNATKDSALNISAPGVLTNDSGAPSPTAAAIVAGPTTGGGAVTLNADGSFTYTPVAGFTGTDTFTYTITNGQAPPAVSDAQATVMITVDAAPTVTATTPTNGATNQTTNANISVTFSESVNVTASWFTISCTSSGAHTAAVTGGPTTFTLNPDVDFTPAETCTVTVAATQVADQDSNDQPDNMTADFIFSFSLDAAPGVSAATPTNGATGVATNSNLSVTFSEPVSAAGTWFTISCTVSGAHMAAVTGGPTTFTLNPTADFAQNEICTLSVVAAHVVDQDAADPPDNMLADYVISFVTDAAPSVSATTPTNGATSQTTNTNIDITFSEPVNVSGTWFTISCTTSGAHTAAVTGGPTTFTLNPGVDFTGGEQCTVTIAAAQVADQDSNDPPDNMAANYVFSFAVDAGPTVNTTTPTNGATQVANNANVTITFSEPVNVTGEWFSFNCQTSGTLGAAAFNVTPDGSNTVFTLDKLTDYANGEQCTVTIAAAQVADQDSNDPPDNMAANYVFSFAVDSPPTVTTTSPANGAIDVAENANVVVNFSENVNVTTSSFTLECPSGAPKSFAVSGSGSSAVTLDPTADLPPGVICTVTVVANQVSDSDAGDPPDNLAANYVFSFGVKPRAVDDSLNATGNIRVQTAGAGRSGFSVRTNDIGPGITVTAFDANSARGGNVSVAADGTLIYNPPPGYEGADSFNYTISNTAGSDVGTVIVSVTGMIWFINNAAASCTTLAAGCGRLTNPFSTLAAFEALNGGATSNGTDVVDPEAGDHIFLYSGSGAYAGPLTLENNQRLIGQGTPVATGSLQGLSGLTPAADSDALPPTGGTAPSITTSAVSTNGINLASGNRLYGFTVGDTTGIDISGASVGTLTVRDVSLSGTGRALSLANGTLDVIFGAIGVTSRTGTGVFLDAVGGTAQFGATTISNPTNAGGNGFHVEDSSAAVTIAAATIDNPNQTAGQADGNNDFIPDNDGDGNAIFLRSNTGSFTLNGGTLSNCGNDCIDARNAQNLTISGVTINNPGTDVTGASGSGTGGHGVQAINITGTNSITGSTITAWNTQARDGVRYINHTSTASALTITGTTFSNSASGSNAILVSGRDAADMTLNVGGPTNNPSTNCTFSNVFGAAITHNAGDTAGSTATVNLNVRNNTFSGSPNLGQNTVSARNLAGGKATVVITGNTFDNVAFGLSDQSGVIDIGGDASLASNSLSVNVSNNTIKNIGSNTGDCDGGGAGTLPCQSRRAIDVQVDDNTNVSGTIVIDGNTITNVVRAGIVFDVSDIHNGNNSVTAKITNNTVGTDAQPVGYGTVVAAGGESGIRVENRDNASPATNLNILVSGNSVRNGNGGAGLTINTSGIFVRSQNIAVISATVTSNNVSTNTSSGAFELNAVTNFGSGPTLCFDASGNTLAAGAGSVGLSEVVGTLNVEQASAAALATANGIPSGNVTVSGSPTFGITCSTPPSLLLAAGGIEAAEPGLSGSTPANAVPASVGAIASVAPKARRNTVLSEADLDAIVGAALARWEATGLTAAQQAGMRDVQFEVADLPGQYLGAAGSHHTLIDSDAGGSGWFIDPTPLDDAEFGMVTSGTRLYTDPRGAPAGRIDLLTAVMHELGHAAGLPDSYAQGYRDNLMYGHLTKGERRLPLAVQAPSLAPGTCAGTHFLSVEPNAETLSQSPSQAKPQPAAEALSRALAFMPPGGSVNHSIGTLPAGKSVSITFQVTVNNPFGGTNQVSNQGTVTGTIAAAPFSVVTDDPATGTADDATITPVLEDASANDDNYTTFKDTPLNVPAPGILDNDGGSPTAVSITNGPTAAGGVVTLNADGSFSYTPASGYTGPDSFTYTASNGGGSNTATVNITVAYTSSIYVNEVMFNPPGGDAPNEYIELRGAAGATVPPGTYFVAIEGDGADNPGDVQTIINLSALTFGSNGFLVLLQKDNTYTTEAGTTVIASTTTGFGGLPGGVWQADSGATDIKDSSVTFMLVQTGVVPTLTGDIDPNDDGTPDGSVFSGWNVRDSIAALNGGANVRGYGALNYRATGGTGSSTGTEVGIGFDPGYVGRIGDSTDSTASDWVASGVLGGSTPHFTLGNAINTEPASFAGKALNHIGTSNFTNVAPVNTVPVAQSTSEDTPLVFTGATQISISDADAGGATVQASLTAANGTFSLSGTSGLNFACGGCAGDGANDTSMVFQGTITDINNALNNLTFSPTTNFSSPPDASLTILTDDLGNTGSGGAKTDSDTVIITVGTVNAPPSFTIVGNPPTINEDAGAQTVSGFASNISQGAGESGQSLTFNVSPAGTTGNIAFSSGPAIDPTTGNLTYAIQSDTNGTATFNVTLSDNGSTVPPNSNTSGTQQFTITVGAVNDAPTFQITSNPPAVGEDAGAQTVNGFTTNFQPGPVTATDEAGQTLTGYAVTLVSSTGNLTFSTGPSIDNVGQLTYTPTTNTSGTATFNVVAIDSGNSTTPNVNQSAPVAFTITVNGENDAPGLDNTGSMMLNAINEDLALASNSGTLVSDIINSASGDRITDADAGALEGIAVTAVNNAGGTWQFSIDNGSNWILFGTPDAINARLLASNATTRVRFVPSLDFDGTVDPGITFRAWDQTEGVNGNTANVTTNGGTTAFSTITETASIIVNAVNDAPSFTKGADQIIPVNSGTKTVSGWATAISPGPANESGQAVSFAITNNTNPGLFSTAPTVGPTGTLTYRPADNTVGTASITLQAKDNGGTAGGGQDTSAAQTFIITVNPGNSSSALTSSLNPSDYGDSVTLKAVVTAVGPSTGTPQGTVTFKDGSTTLGTGTLNTSGEATLATTSLAAGPHSITAEYGGSSIFNQSVSGTLTQTVNKAQSTVSVVSSANPSDLGQDVPFTATVTSGGGTPTGAVTFKDNGMAITGCSNKALTSGQATCTATGLTVGNHTITADYNGDANFTASTGTLPGGQVVNISASISINDVSLTEGHAGPKSFDFIVTLSQASNVTVRVDFATANGTAASGSDYQPSSGTLTFNPGDLTKVVTVTVQGDTASEPDETFFVNLSNAQNSTISDNQGRGTILNDDAPAVQFSANTYNINEGVAAGFGTVTVNRLGDTSQPLTVDYMTSDQSGMTPCQINGNGIASDRCDYGTAAGMLQFEAGESSKTIDIVMINDGYVEPAEQFSIRLLNPGGGALGADDTATVTIIDDDQQPAATNPIEDLDFFLFMQYVDFMGRVPEPAGFQFWKQRMTTNCPQGQTCDRVDTSLRFFESDEFKERGLLVYTLYHAGLGRRPLYAEWIQDVSKLNGYKTVAEQEAAKDTYIKEFINRQEFLNLYQGSQTGQAFVDALVQKSGATPASKQTLIDNYQTVGRAKTIRAFMETPEVQATFFDRAFITMLYFGYLRRDAEPGGYAFWMQKLNDTNHDYRFLVGGFLQSDEYRFRFAFISSTP